MQNNQKCIIITWKQQNNILCIRRKLPRKEIILVSSNTTLERVESLVAFIAGRDRANLATLDGMIIEHLYELVEGNVYQVL